MDEDARMFRIRNCWMMSRDLDEWKGFLEEAKTQRGVVGTVMMMYCVTNQLEIIM